MTDTSGTGTPAGQGPDAGTPGHGHAPTTLTALGWTSFLMPLIVSVLANLTWGVGTGSVVLIVAGLVSPLLLVLAVERWRALPGLTGAARVVQVAGMGIVATVAAGWSWVHTTELLLKAMLAAYDVPTISDLPWLVVVLCVVAPLAVDGLAVLSVQTLAIAPGTSTGTAPSVPAVSEVPERQTVPANSTDGWGPADTVPSAPPARPARARSVPSVAGQRTKRELTARARELSVPRKAKEPLEQFRARVEAAERAHGMPVPDRVPGPDALPADDALPA